MDARRRLPILELPTLLVMLLCYACWLLVIVVIARVSVPLAVVLLIPVLALHSSLQHEVIHGHPFRSRKLSELSVFPALGLLVPYIRFRDQHLQHHMNARLTDPYDDPETNYLDPAMWKRLAPAVRSICNFNNTLMGRMLIGPSLSIIAMLGTDIPAIRAGDRSIGWAWQHHALGSAVVLLIVVAVSPIPVWAYLVACYFGYSVLKIRTYLEHQANEHARARSVVVEDRGVLAFLFLNNNFHAVHHMHPAVPWYRLPGLYAQNRDRYLTRNGGYRFDSYATIFRRFFLTAKDPVPHPLWTEDGPIKRP